MSAARSDTTSDDLPTADAPIEVFWSSGSTPSWRVLLTLACKGVPYVSRPVRLRRGEQRRPDFLAVSPRGKVPAIRAGSFTLHESAAIMAYLDRRFPEPPLFGRDPEETGRVWCAVAAHEGYFRPPMLALVRPVLYGGPGVALAQAEAIGAAGAGLVAELGALDAALADRPYLAGDRVTAADLFVYPDVMLVARAADRARRELGILPLDARFPRVAAWCGRVEALPGYAEAYPPSWRE